VTKTPSPDPRPALLERLRTTVYEAPAVTTPSLRRAAASDAGVPAPLATYVHAIHANAYQITDADVALLRATHDDDTLFEVTVAAALGASFRRLDLALAAIDAVEHEDDG